MKKLIFLLFVTTACLAQSTETKKDSLIDLYLHNCAKNYSYTFFMQEYQDCLDKGLKEDSTIATFWQQKAMPYFKARKYEVGMKFIDKAVKYNARTYQPYRSFIKCIFSKQYEDAIIDFEDCIAKWGDQYEMGHTYSFHIGLSYLQLNEFSTAEKYLTKTINDQIEKFGEAHYTNLFYQAISIMEQQRYAEADSLLQKVIDIYPEFPEASYYKGLSELRLGREFETAKKRFDDANRYYAEGYTINEDNAIYEMYPYQFWSFMYEKKSE